MAPLRIAFVVQRYGIAVNGGAEHHCRLLAERLARRAEVGSVTVLTTCSRDYRTWRNDEEPGHSILNGVRIERFPTVSERKPRQQWALQAMLPRLPHPMSLERAWLEAQGPVVPGLLDRLRETHANYDAIVFFTYLYYPTVAGITIPRKGRVLWPTAHDEPAIHLRLYDTVFLTPEAIAFNSEEERDFVCRRFPVGDKPADTIGCGIDLPEATDADGERMITSPYLLYMGRIAKNKGVHRLVEHFARFKRERAAEPLRLASRETTIADLKLVLVGTGDFTGLPERDDVVRAGFVSEADKAKWLRHCEVLIMPSRLESLSLVTLEAWAAYRPVMVDAACAVTLGHVRRSGGGFSFANFDEFSSRLAQLLADPDRRRSLGETGRAYVETNYSWQQVETKMLRLLSNVAKDGVPSNAGALL